MHTLLFDLWRATQNAMIIITHDIDEALFLGQQIVVINGHPGTIKAEYKNSFFQQPVSQAYAEPTYLKFRNRLLKNIC